MKVKVNHKKRFPMLYSIPLLLIGTTFPLCIWSSPAGWCDEKGASEIRQPQGNEGVEAFWNSFKWTELNPAEQALWGKLDWSKASWERKAPAPAFEKKAWAELSSDERDTANANQ